MARNSTDMLFTVFRCPSYLYFGAHHTYFKNIVIGTLEPQAMQVAKTAVALAGH